MLEGAASKTVKGFLTMQAAHSSPFRRISVIDRPAIVGWTALVIMLGSMILAALQLSAPSGATYDEVVLLALNAAWAHLPLETLQWVLLNENLPELVLVGGLVAAWNARRVGSLDRGVLRRRVLLTVLAFVPTYAITRFVQHLGHQPRPNTFAKLVPLADPVSWAGMAHNFTGFSSFPSDHAALSAIAAVMAFSIGRGYGWFFTLFGVYVSVFRIAFGFHWPSDVVGGVLVGTIVGSAALLARPVLRRFLGRVVVAFDEHPAIAAVLAVLFLSEFGTGFARLQGISYGLGHGRLFH